MSASTPRCNCHDRDWRPGNVGYGHAKLCPMSQPSAESGAKVVYDDGRVYQGTLTLDQAAYSPEPRSRPPE